MVLEKDGGEQLDRLCDKGRSITKSQARQDYPKYNEERKANWIGNILHSNCPLKHIIEGNTKTLFKSEKHLIYSSHMGG